MSEPAAKRRALSVSRQSDEQRADLLPSLLQLTGICSVVARYMTVTELVKVRRVCQRWQQLFSEPCCWVGSKFKPSYNQITSQLMRLDRMPWLEQLHLADGGSASDRAMDGLGHDILIRPYKQQLAACTNLALQRLHIQGDVDAALARAMPKLRELHVDGGIAAAAIPLLKQVSKLEATCLTDNEVTAMIRHAATPAALQSVAHWAPSRAAADPNVPSAHFTVVHASRWLRSCHCERAGITRQADPACCAVRHP